ncbi:MAG TPA: GDSL-type esterase/lipase family protein [Candidatus Hydrogenedentes bacterium]|nr:GDSL-type esterase/lipase family protein [Candidatus Hydrogenedentota bacterium]
MTWIRLKNMVLLLTSLIIAAGVIEGAGRFLANRKERAMLVSSVHLNWTMCHEYDPVLMWRLKPNLKDVPQGYSFKGVTQQWTASTNAHGLRGAPLSPKGGRFRILAIGDSRTYGLGVGDGDTYPVYLQAAFDREQTGSVDVVNAGVPGYTTLQGLQYLRERGMDLDPDLVLVCFAYNDAVEIPAPGIGDCDWENPKASPFGFISLLKDAVRGAHLDRAPLFSPRKARLRPGEMLDCLIEIQNVCAAHGAQAVFLAWPALSEIIGEELNQPHYAGIVTEAARLAHTPAISLHALLEEHSDRIFLDDIHLNAEGNRVVADYLAGEIRKLYETGLLSNRTARPPNTGTPHDPLTDDEAAMARYRKWIVADPSCFMPYEKLDALLRRRGDAEARIHEWRAFSERFPDQARPWFALGHALFAVNDLDGALEAYRKAAELDPADPAKPVSIGATLFRKGDMDGAAAAFKAAIQIDPKHSQVRMRFIEMLCGAGRFADAKAQLAECRQLGIEIPSQLARHVENGGK